MVGAVAPFARPVLAARAVHHPGAPRRRSLRRDTALRGPRPSPALPPSPSRVLSTRASRPFARATCCSCHAPSPCCSVVRCVCVGVRPAPARLGPPSRLLVSILSGRLLPFQPLRSRPRSSAAPSPIATAAMPRHPTSAQGGAAIATAAPAAPPPLSTHGALAAPRAPQCAQPRSRPTSGSCLQPSAASHASQRPSGPTASRRARRLPTWLPAHAAVTPASACVAIHSAAAAVGRSVIVRAPCVRASCGAVTVAARRRGRECASCVFVSLLFVCSRGPARATWIMPRTPADRPLGGPSGGAGRR